MGYGAPLQSDMCPQLLGCLEMRQEAGCRKPGWVGVCGASSPKGGGPSPTALESVSQKALLIPPHLPCPGISDKVPLRLLRRPFITLSPHSPYHFLVLSPRLPITLRCTQLILNWSPNLQLGLVQGRPHPAYLISRRLSPSLQAHSSEPEGVPVFAAQKCRESEAGSGSLWIEWLGKQSGIPKDPKDHLKALAQQRCPIPCLCSLCRLLGPP